MREGGRPVCYLALPRVTHLALPRVTRFGVIPKNNQPGQWRLILDLSSPEGHSVNDGIPKPLFSVHYVTVDSFIEHIMAQGRGTLMAKFDVVSAHCNVAIHPQDHSL